MLAELSGQTHQVFTAVALIHHDSRTGHALSVATEVKFKALTEEEMAAYHSRIDPMDKAGAYARPEHGALIIERIAGSMSNVIGLPMEEVAEALERHSSGSVRGLRFDKEQSLPSPHVKTARQTGFGGFVARHQYAATRATSSKPQSNFPALAAR